MSNDRNYDDLKARLGLKKPAEPSAPAEAPQSSEAPAPAAAAPTPAEDIGEPPGERTPPGGFDLGLERGGMVMDEEAIDVDKAAAAMISPGGDDIAIKKSPAMKIMILVLMIIGCGAALGIGYQMGVGNTEGAFTARQAEDATAIKKRLLSAKTGDGSGSIKEAVDAHAALITEVHKATEEVRTAEQLTDALLKKVEGELRRLHKGSIAYVQKNAVYNPERLVGTKVFNEKAVQLALKLDSALRTLHQTTLVMAREEAVLAEFQSMVDLKKLKAPSVTKEWAAVSYKDKDGRPLGLLVGVQVQRDKDGNAKFRKDPIKVEEGFQLPAGVDPFVWQIEVKYDNPKQMGGEEGGWVDAKRIVEWDLKRDIEAPLRDTVSKHHELYKTMVLRRLISHVDALKKAADDAVAIRAKVAEELEKL